MAGQIARVVWGCFAAKVGQIPSVVPCPEAVVLPTNMERDPRCTTITASLRRCHTPAPRVVQPELVVSRAAKNGPQDDFM